jgi:hypothetical protein
MSGIYPECGKGLCFLRILCYRWDSATTFAPVEQNIYRTKINKQQETPAEFYIYVENFKLVAQPSRLRKKSRRRPDLSVAQASRLLFF